MTDPCSVVDALAAEVDITEETLAEFKERCGDLAGHVHVGGLPDDEKLNTLPQARRLFLHLINMI